jgi:hypothetical protein
VAVCAPVLSMFVRVYALLSKSPGILEVAIHPLFEALVGGSNVELPSVVACVGGPRQTTVDRQTASQRTSQVS